MVSRFTHLSLRSALLVLLSLGATALLSARTTWVGTQDTLFSNAANWSNGLPAADNDAVIPGGSTVFFDTPLEARFALESFGDLRLGARVNVRANWQLGGSLATGANRLNVYDTLQNFGSIAIQTDGSVFVTPTGSLRSNGTIVNDGWLGSRGSLRNERQITVNAGHALAIYEEGVFANPGIVDVFGVLNVRNGGRYTAPSGGTINVKDGGRLRNYTGASITNAGVIRVDAGGLFRQEATLNNVPGRIFVSGNLTTYDASETASNFLTVEEGGVLNVDAGEGLDIVFSLVNSGTVRLNRPAIVRGLISNNADASFTVTGIGELDFVLGTNLNNEGTFLNQGRIRTVGTLNNDGTFTNDGDITQDGSGTIANNNVFVNKKLITSVDRIVNNGSFSNEGRITNGSGGQIENNGTFTNAVDAHIQNLFEIFNRDLLVNNGYFENGVSIFNEATFRNAGFLNNVGDIVNTPAGVIDNIDGGVIDNSGSGIFTNEGIVNNDGELNNFSCGVLVNNNLINNRQWISNDGILLNNGTITGKALMGNGVNTTEGGSSPLICQPYTQKLDPNGNSRIGAPRFATARFDSCTALQYLVDGEEFVDVTCADIGTREVILTLRDRRGNEVNCKTTLTIVDNGAPIVSGCPGDIAVEIEAGESAATVAWTEPTFVDNCDDDIDVSVNKRPGDTFPEGNTVVTYTATDNFGNSVQCEFTVTVTVKVPEDQCTPKNADGLITYYNFAKGDLRYVFDRAGYGNPLHLETKDLNTIKRDGECGLVNTGHSIVKSFGSATNIADRVKMTNAISVEAFVRADKLQSGPARVVTFSENVSARNFTLGQDGNRWVFRLKTTHTNGNGMPNRQASSGSVKVGQLQHVVFTRTSGGQERFYVDGQLVYSGHTGGDLSNWGRHCNLALFNELTLDRAFKGAIKKVAIYDRALSAAEIEASLDAGACCDGDDSPLGQICQGPRGQVSYERYDGINGVDLPWLYKADKYPNAPSATKKLTSLSIPANVGENYGSRTRGWIYPTKTGHYRFAVSGDDQTRLLLSRTDGHAGFAYSVASVTGWTNPGDLHRFHTQKSESFELQAGGAYYFELQHKEGVGGDHAGVYWKQPGSSNFQLIGAEYIGDIKACPPPAPEDCLAERGGLLREVWTGIASTDVWDLLQDPRYPNTPTSRNVISSFRGPINDGDYYGTRVRGYIVPTESGKYKFTVTGDDQTKLMLSTDDT